MAKYGLIVESQFDAVHNVAEEMAMQSIGSSYIYLLPDELLLEIASLLSTDAEHRPRSSLQVLLPNLHDLDIAGFNVPGLLTELFGRINFVPFTYHNLRGLILNQCCVRNWEFPFPPLTKISYQVPTGYILERDLDALEHVPALSSLRSLALELPLCRGFIEEASFDRFKRYISILAEKLQCSSLVSLELVFIRTTRRAKAEFRRSSTPSFYYDETFVPVGTRITNFSAFCNLQHLTVPMLIVEDEKIPLVGRFQSPHWEVQPVSDGSVRLQIRGLEYYSKTGMTQFHDPGDDSSYYQDELKYPGWPNLPRTIHKLEIWVCTDQNVNLTQRLSKARHDYPQLRHIIMRVPVANGVPYVEIKNNLEEYVELFRNQGVLLQFLREELWRAVDERSTNWINGWPYYELSGSH
ncbi:hypothetical protein BDV96DRAFT_633956 [Lophiotrema nucula]|uniref:Uncharacterized protein n=1 Tax=Lophiotrema nucula TaxID=690887 RepID=A0A6A5Z123_9PLEO|nr:hypothetical protein BDV96DRAFT_633956 [Lophiotrema nucula]